MLNALIRAGMSAGEEAAEWDIRVLEAQQAVTMQASAMAGAYGSLLNVTTDDILWGMGQVIVQPTLTCVCWWHVRFTSHLTVNFSCTKCSSVTK